MKQIPNIEDERRGFVTYELPDGRRVRLDARDVQERGAAEMIRSVGLGDQIDGKQLPVLQGGVMVGTLPVDFDPTSIRSRSSLYDPRPGDFVRKGEAWIANSDLGLGDLQAVPGFKPA